MYTYLKPTKILYYGFQKIAKYYSGAKLPSPNVNRTLFILDPKYNENSKRIKEVGQYLIKKMKEGELTPEELESVHKKNILDARQNIERLDLLEKSGEMDEYTRILYEDELSRACNKPLEYCDKSNVSGDNKMHSTITGGLKEYFYEFRRLVAYKEAKLYTQIHDSSCEEHDMSLCVGNTRHNYLASESENHDNEIKAKHGAVTCDGKYLIKTTKNAVWYRESYLNYKIGRPDYVNYLFYEIDRTCPYWVRVNSKYEREVFIPNVDVSPGLKFGKSFISPIVFNANVDKNDAYNLKAASALGTISDNYVNGSIKKDIVMGIARGDLPKDYKLLDIIKLFHKIINES